MKEKELKQIYKEYFDEFCEWDKLEDSEEIKRVIKDIELQKLDHEKYRIETDYYGNYIIYKNRAASMSADEMKAFITVEQAKNIRSIKKYVKLFYILTVIALVCYGIFWLISIFN